MVFVKKPLTEKQRWQDLVSEDTWKLKSRLVMSLMCGNFEKCSHKRISTTNMDEELLRFFGCYRQLQHVNLERVINDMVESTGFPFGTILMHRLEYVIESLPQYAPDLVEIEIYTRWDWHIQVARFTSAKRHGESQSKRSRDGQDGRHDWMSELNCTSC